MGNLLKGKGDIVVGDFVELKEEANTYIIKSVEDRKNEIFRILPRERKKKVSASNCDYIVILNSVSKPVYKTGIVDRYLVRAHQWGIEPLVVFNKMDQYDPECFDIRFERDRLQQLGAKCFEISAVNTDYKNQYLEMGMEDLKQTLAGKTSILLGQSGVGKSKTISAVSGHEVELLSQQVGKSGKGAHTTTWAELVDCESFELIDSPGIRSFALDDIDPQDLLMYFPDLEHLATQCKFRDCEHLESSKGCAFWSLDPSDPATEHIHSRLDSYLRILQEVSETPFWQKKY